MEVFVKPSFVAAIQDADARVFGNRLMEPEGHEILFSFILYILHSEDVAW